MTTRKKPGILGPNARRFPCRFCAEKFEDFDQLRFHAQSSHQRAFHQVNRSLAKIDAKLRSLEKLAEEGMKGHDARRDDAADQSGTQYGIRRDGWWQVYVEASNWGAELYKQLVGEEDEAA